MARSLNALNPCNSCFTLTDFDDALIDIKGILKHIDSFKKEEKSESHSLDFQKKQLENAFLFSIKCLNAADKKQPDKQLSFFLADILSRYATLYYKENYFAAKQIFVAAMHLHLYTIGIFSECIEMRDFVSLEDLKKQGETKPLMFSSTEQLILSTSMDRCMGQAYKESFIHDFSKNKLFSLAKTAYHLGCCYQHIDETKIENPENALRFSQLFGLSESLFLLIDNENSHTYLADLYLNAKSFIYQRKYPDDVAGIMQYYDAALSYDSSIIMQARIANKKFECLFSHDLKKEVLTYIQKAVSLLETLEPPSEFLLNIYENYANFFMDIDSLDLEQAEIYLSKASNYISERRANGYDRLQFALIDIKLAELKLFIGELGLAKETTERALITLNKYPFSNTPYLFETEGLKSLILKKLRNQQVFE